MKKASKTASMEPEDRTNGRLSWEEILALAQHIETDPSLFNLQRLQVAIKDFDNDIRRGHRKLPKSWKPYAVHLLGYENDGAS